MAWNHDISQAPKSHQVETVRTIKGEARTVMATQSVYIIAAYGGDKTMRTRWLPDERRWEGFATGQQPEAWQDWPLHPSLEKELVQS